MTVDVGPAAVDPADETVGLWSEKWFRIVTIVNSSIVAVSAVCAIAGILTDDSATSGWLFVAFPVVPAAFLAWPLFVIVLAAAAALSCLNMIGARQKGVRFLRAMTVWGAIVLGLPLVFTTIAALCFGVATIFDR